MLKAIGELFGLQIEVTKPLARCHPQSILPVLANVAEGYADSAFPKWICGESLCSTIVFDQERDRRIGQHPEIAGLVFMQIIRG